MTLGQADEMPSYNYAYLDEQTKRMIRRAILKAVAVPGYQVPFGSREMPLFLSICSFFNVLIV